MQILERAVWDGVWFRLRGWGRVRVRGPHAERFLHSQVTSDVKRLAAGECRLSALLDRTGRLRAMFLLARFDDGFELLTPPGLQSVTADALSGNVIADDVEIELGDGAELRLAVGPAVLTRAVTGGDRQRRTRTDAFGAPGVIAWDQRPFELPQAGDAELETLMVAAGVPRWGRDAAAGQLVNETSLVDTAVSFSKGCFLGQETVAKVRSNRGAVRHPVALVELTGETDPAALVGQSFGVGQRAAAGTVLAAIEWQGAPVLTASLHRELRVEDRRLELRLDGGGSVSAKVRSLPLLRPETPAALADRLYHRGVEHFQADRENDALELLERAVAVDPGHADAYEVLGVIHGRAERYDVAVDWMRRLLEVDPDSVMAHTNLSLYHMRCGRIDEAEEEARQAALAGMRRRQDDEARREAERQAAEQRAADAARRETMFRQVLQLDPDDALGNFGLGELLVERGQHAAAREHLARALEADPRYSAALLALGRAEVGLGDTDAARETLSRGLEVATAKGDLATANKMQELLTRLGTAPASG